MARNKGKKKRAPSPVSSDSDTDDSALDSSQDSDDSDSGRHVSGQRSSDSGNDGDTGDESEVDIRDQYLPVTFQPKPIKCVVSEWAKRKLRGPFLGTPLSKDEKNQLTEDYFCSPEDWKLFSAPKVSDSPLALMLTSTSTALIDITRIHNDLLFAMRVGLLSYENILHLVSNWAREKPIPDTNRVIPAGKWASVSYRFQQGFPVPVPYKLREDIKVDAVREFLDRNIMTQHENTEDKLKEAVKYALSYKEAFERLQASAADAHTDACALQLLSNESHSAAIKLAKDTGSSMRVLGGVCQQIKRMREEEYSKPLDPGFKKFLAHKKASKTPKENMNSRADCLIDEDLAAQAKSYEKIKKVMAGVSKTKMRKEAQRKAQAAKRKAEAKSTGPPPKKKYKPPPATKGKGKGKGKGKNTSKPKAGSSKEKDKDKDSE